jgi:hypothetical protein
MIAMRRTFPFARLNLSVAFLPAFSAPAGVISSSKPEEIKQ